MFLPLDALLSTHLGLMQRRQYIIHIELWMGLLFAEAEIINMMIRGVDGNPVVSAMVYC